MQELNLFDQFLHLLLMVRQQLVYLLVQHLLTVSRLTQLLPLLSLGRLNLLQHTSVSVPAKPIPPTTHFSVSPCQTYTSHNTLQCQSLPNLHFQQHTSVSIPAKPTPPTTHFSVNPGQTYTSHNTLQCQSRPNLHLPQHTSFPPYSPGNQLHTKSV